MKQSAAGCRSFLIDIAISNILCYYENAVGCSPAVRCRCPVRRVKRESGENPGQSRCCYGEADFLMSLRNWEDEASVAFAELLSQNTCRQTLRNRAIDPVKSLLLYSASDGGRQETISCAYFRFRFCRAVFVLFCCLPCMRSVHRGGNIF